MNDERTCPSVEFFLKETLLNGKIVSLWQSYLCIFPLTKNRSTYKVKECDIAHLFYYFLPWHCIVVASCIE
jgi:hypothetical protein